MNDNFFTYVKCPHRVVTYLPETQTVPPASVSVCALFDSELATCNCGRVMRIMRIRLERSDRRQQHLQCRMVQVLEITPQM